MARRTSWTPLPGDSYAEPVRLKQSINQVLRGWGIPKVDYLSKIFTVWPDLVGVEIAAVSEPLNFVDNELLVQVSDGGWASRLRWMENELVTQINSHLGASIVTRIRWRVARKIKS